MMSDFVNEIREEIAQETQNALIPFVPSVKADEKRCYTVDEIQSILGICRKTAYSLLKKKEFHWFKIGSTYRISKKSFDEWLDSKA